MEELQYIIEDRTIAVLLGEQNFTNKESAILELVKNAYDAVLHCLQFHSIMMRLLFLITDQVWIQQIFDRIGCTLV